MKQQSENESLEIILYPQVWAGHGEYVRAIQSIAKSRSMSSPQYLSLLDWISVNPQSMDPRTIRSVDDLLEAWIYGGGG